MRIRILLLSNMKYFICKIFRIDYYDSVEIKNLEYQVRFEVITSNLIREVDCTTGFSNISLYIFITRSSKIK